LAPELERLGLLTLVDRACFAGYCQAWARWREAEEVIAREGPTVEGHRHIQRKHPLTSVAGRYLDAMRAFAIEFGLMPQSRTRIHAPSLPEDDDDEGLD
jgi:P27 family predicted phage terminase small subunit